MKFLTRDGFRIFDCLNCRATVASKGFPSRCHKCKAAKLFLKLRELGS